MIDLNQYIGIPHKPQGRDRNGVDCWGLVCLVYADMGVALPHYDGWYARTDEMEALHSVADTERTRWKQVNTPQPLDVVLLNVPTSKGRFPAHVGLVEDSGMMLHAEHGRDVAREMYTGKRWGNRIEGFFHYVR